ncbi:uncharacterized protein LOC136062102 [Quercus suber]|uniref:uncharacterized protein LOC136062102 n=1 Tax=Quercus suber TaxID=58331 RepID=UPI0032DE7E40
MFCFHSFRQLLLLKHRMTQLGFLQQNAFFIVKSYASTGLSESKHQQQQQEKHSFTVSYLINSCGLSSKSAILASQKVQLGNPDRPDSVLSLLKEHGFTNTQIAKLVRTHPMLLLSDPGKTLLPKIEFFLSKVGVSSSDLTRILTSSPLLLDRSLENHLIPCYNFLKSVLLVDEKVIKTLKRSQLSFLFDVTNNMVPNIALLREFGVPESAISFLVTNFPAIQVILKMKKPIWESKLEVYKRWGWSKDVALLAFRRYPNCVLLSEEKITKTMDFLVHKMGCPSADIAKNPSVLGLSLEKRIIPRCSVVQVLLAKDLIKIKFSSATLLLPSEKCFLEKFVIKFQANVPQLLDVYQGKMDLLDVGIQSEKVWGMEQL